MDFSIMRDINVDNVTLLPTTINNLIIVFQYPIIQILKEAEIGFSLKNQRKMF